MPNFLLDTDHVTLLQHRHARLLQRLAPHPLAAVAVSAVTVEETLRGRLAALANARVGAARVLQYRHLLEAVQFLSQLQLLAYDTSAENSFQQLLTLRLRIGTRDLKIAAVALANGLTLLTRNRRDFGRIPGLTLDDWSV
jgi:tRNA(fMet)-specific endonuclease VapC